MSAKRNLRKKTLITTSITTKSNEEIIAQKKPKTIINSKKTKAGKTAGKKVNATNTRQNSLRLRKKAASKSKGKTVNKIKYSGNNNKEKSTTDVKENNCNADLDSSGSSIENKMPVVKENVSDKEAQNESKLVRDTSVFDYDEQESDEESNYTTKVNLVRDRQCKHCKMIYESPLELLRHTRDCYNFPKPVLPPEEIEKYFDYPNRSYCPICEKPIKTRNFRSIFIKHLLVHTTGLTHQCAICQKNFRRKDHMRAHQKRHVVSV